MRKKLTPIKQKTLDYYFSNFSKVDIEEMRTMEEAVHIKRIHKNHRNDKDTISQTNEKSEKSEKKQSKKNENIKKQEIINCIREKGWSIRSKQFIFDNFEKTAGELAFEIFMNSYGMKISNSKNKQKIS